MLDLEDLEADARRRFGTTADLEVPGHVDPERWARFAEWREARRAERAGKSVGAAWTEGLSDDPRHTGLENERRKRNVKNKLSDDQKKSFKAMREACKALRSDANIGDECKALMSKIDECLGASEDGEKATKTVFADAVNSTAAELADAGNVAGAIQALRMNPQRIRWPSTNFDGK
jgi:hypothetical protein